jgi:hypothetical protein
MDASTEIVAAEDLQSDIPTTLLLMKVKLIAWKLSIITFTLSPGKTLGVPKNFQLHISKSTI